MTILLGYFLTFLYIFLVMGLTALVSKWFHTDKEISRKMIHIEVSFSFFIIYYFLGNTWHACIPPFIFIILNYVSYKKGLFQVMERSGKEESPGTVYYALSMFLLAMISLMKENFLCSFGIGFFCMALGDGIAPIIGKRISSHRFSNGKTIVGSICMCLISMFVAIFFCYFYSYPIYISFVCMIGIASMILEWLGTKGLDNLLVPIGVSFISYGGMLMYGIIV